MDFPVLQRLNLEGCAQIYCNTEDSLDLPSLEWLCLSESSICHISCLNGLHSLRELYLSGCVHLDAQNINKLDWPALQELDLSGSNWLRVELLTRLLELKVLNLNECLELDVDNCEEVLDLPRLEELHISGSNFSNLSLFASASKLERLNMRDLRSKLDRSDIEALKCHCLKRLSCDYAIKKLLPEDYELAIQQRLFPGKESARILARRISEAHLFTDVHTFV